MYVIKSKGRRGDADVMWLVGGVAKVINLEDAIELAFDAHAAQLAESAQEQRTLWTVYA